MENEKELDYLFITDKLEEETVLVCGLALYSSVYDDFQHRYKFYRKQETEKPNHYWRVTNYLHDNSDVGLFEKVKVIIAFAWRRGIIEYDGMPFNTAMDLLAKLKQNDMITEQELSYIADKLFNEINKGIIADFEEKENAPE